MTSGNPTWTCGDGARCAFVIDGDRFDGQIYNVLTLNATVQEIADAIRSFVPDLQIELVDSRIMNQLSYTVSADKFARLGFGYSGDLRQGIGDTVGLLRALRRSAVPALD